MDVLQAIFLLFVLPIGLYMVLAAFAGFLYQPLQILMLLLGGIAVAVFSAGLASGGMFAPLLILPLIVTYALGAAASLLITRSLNNGHAREAASLSSSLSGDEA